MQKAESDIILLAQGGDTRTFRVLVERYQGFAYALTFRFTVETGSAEDIVQEAVTRVWKNLSRYRTEIKFSSWRYTIVTNRCLDYLRSRHGRSRRHLGNVELVLHERSVYAADAYLHQQELVNAILLLVRQYCPATGHRR